MLGSRKLLIVLCIVPCVLSLLCIGAFAAPAEDVTPSVDIPIETELVEDVVKSPSVIAEETFPAKPLLESSYYSYSIFSYDLPYSPSSWDNVLMVKAYANGSYVGGFSLDNGSIWVGYVNNLPAVFFGSGASDYLPLPSGTVSLEVTSSASTQTSRGGTTLSGTLVENDLIPELADSVFDLGDALITFIVSSWVVLIPLAAWLVILCIGAIRKLVKGV